MASYDGRGDSYSYRGRGGRRGRSGYRGRGRYNTGSPYPEEGVGHSPRSPHQHEAAAVVQAPPPPPPRQAKNLIVSDGWQYRDPEGDIHGPFLAAKIVNWVDKGFFSEGLPVRKVTPAGMGAWTALRFVLLDIRREAALTVVPVREQEPEVTPVSASRAPPPPPTRVNGSQSPLTVKTSVDRDTPEEAMNKPNPRSGTALLSRGAHANFPAPRPSRDTWDRRRGGGRYGQGGRSGDRWGTSHSRGGRGDRGGRGRRGRGGTGRGGRGGSNVDPDVADAVRRLFTGEVEQGAEQPMWRYIDYEGATQGPFPAKSMQEWFEQGYLSDITIPICGTERKVSPPNLPPPEFYIPLGALMYWVRRGNHFKPITVADIQSKQLPEELAKLKNSAEKAVEGVNKEKESVVSKLNDVKVSGEDDTEAETGVTSKDEGVSLTTMDTSWAEEDEVLHEVLELSPEEAGVNGDAHEQEGTPGSGTVQELDVKSLEETATKEEDIVVSEDKQEEGKQEHAEEDQTRVITTSNDEEVCISAAADTSLQNEANTEILTTTEQATAPVEEAS